MNPESSSSPRWSSNTKLLFGLIIIGILVFLLDRFASLITPLLMIVILAYLLHPLTSAISRGLRISWRASVNILYLVVLILLISLLTLGGVGLVGQVQSLIASVQEIVANLPAFIDSISGRVFEIGPFTLDMQTLDLNEISRQLLSYVQPLLGRTGNILSALAGGAAEVFGWGFFILLVSYFMMAESSGLRGDLFKVELPGYEEDFRRLGNELSRIWNAFLRGQIFIVLLASVVYTILFSILGVKYAIGLALMAGLAKFLPYIGPLITTITIALVTFFQPDKPFDLSDVWYMLIVLGITSITDQIIDSLIAPRIMARTLKVHPAAVLVTALISANLLGIIGVVIAAPFLASFTLIGRYVTRKLFDQNPWPEKEDPHHDVISSEWIERIRASMFRKRAPEPVKTETQKETKHEQ